MLLAVSQSDAVYRLYGTPKYLGGQHLVWALLAIAGFGIGQQLASVTGRPPTREPEAVDRAVRVGFWAAVCLTLFGYVVWLAVGVRNGFSMATLRALLISGEPGLADVIRIEMFPTVKGVTTCTQFGVAAVLMGIWLHWRGERRVLLPVISLVAIAAGRALLLSERLALIELIVPGTVVVLRSKLLGRPFSLPWRLGLQLAPLGGVAALLIFFGSFEYFRSWRFYESHFDSYIEFTVWRVSGYYTTAHNNGAMVLEVSQPYPLPYSTLRSIWLFPGLGSTPFAYEKLAGFNPAERYEAVLERFGTPELNNEGGLLQPALDFGLPGYPVYWLLAGFVAGRLYRGFLVGTLAGLTFYPLVYLAILEAPRLLYLSNTRSLPSIVLLLFVLWFARRAVASVHPSASTV